jgi:hypothetical protein
MMIAVVLTTASVAIIGALYMARRRRHVDVRGHGSPLLVMPPSSHVVDAGRPSDGAGFAPQRRSPIRQAAVDAAAPHEGLVVVSHARGESAPTVHDPLTTTTNRFISGSVVPEVVHGHTLRFHRPSEGTVEFLPGFLEVIGGPDAGHELRFVRPTDGTSAVITFGRREGPAYTHVQLLEPTVSRSHARLCQDTERWRLVNLSRTNPVIVNRDALDGVEASQLLNDGDVIEMGALVFRFHTK